jgi:hypothetical protein
MPGIGVSLDDYAGLLPEESDVCLLRRSHGAHRPADRLHLVEITIVFIASDWIGSWRSVLRGMIQHEWLSS